jgi:hypothetical protein
MDEGTVRNPEQEPRNGSLWLPFALGVLAPLIFLLMQTSFGNDLGFWSTSIIILAGFSAYSRTRLPERSWAIMVLINLGLPLGIVINVIVDSIIFSHDQNLFPFEFPMWWAVAFFSVPLGIFLGSFFDFGGTKEGMQVSEIIRSDSLGPAISNPNASGERSMMNETSHIPLIPTPEHRAKCHHCGAVIADTDTTCVWCGHKIEHDS